MALDSKTLPNDVMFEILTSVHLDDLATWRQVSREFYEMEKESTFKLQHCLKTNTASGYLTKSNRYNGSYGSSVYSFISEYPINCPVESLPIMKSYYITIEAVSQCRGMICCFDMKSGKGQYYVCKPTTGQCKAIPNPNLRYRTVAIAMVASSTGPVNFKIVRFSIPNNNNIKLFCEIFDSRSWTWHQSKDIKEDIYFPGQGFDRKTGAVFAYGSVHWLIKDFVERKIYIFTFDVEKETWKLIQVPPRHQDFKKNLHSKITLRDGKLCYVNIEDEEMMNLWTMERYGGKAWWRKEVENLKEPNNLKDSWLGFFMDFFIVQNFHLWIAFSPINGRSSGKRN